MDDAVFQNLFGFLSGLIGAVVGGLFTLYATNKALRADAVKEDRQEEKEIQNLLDSLAVELGTLWEFHMRRIGAMIENLKPGDAVEFFYPLTQDYFTLYDSNAHNIGKLRDATLRAGIVKTYNKGKKIVDGFKYNNELYHDWRDYSDSDEQLQDDVRLAGKRKALTDYAMMLKEDHFEMKALVENLLELLQPTSAQDRRRTL